VDHNHATGKVRGVLCLECNAAIGAFKDSVRIVYRAIDYVDPVPIEELATSRPSGVLAASSRRH
jgi:recombination endonuclease VII